MSGVGAEFPGQRRARRRGRPRPGTRARCHAPVAFAGRSASVGVHTGLIALVSVTSSGPSMYTTSCARAEPPASTTATTATAAAAAAPRDPLNAIPDPDPGASRARRRGSRNTRAHSASAATGAAAADPEHGGDGREERREAYVRT